MLPINFFFFSDTGLFILLFFNELNYFFCDKLYVIYQISSKNLKTN